MLYETVALSLLGLKGVGPKSAKDFLSVSELPRHADELQAALAAGGLRRLTKVPDLNEVRCAWDRADEIIGVCKGMGVVIFGGTKPLPPSIVNIPNAPLLLYALGDTNALDAAGMAVVGTREPTDFGRRSAFRMAEVLAELGWTIVSGLAEGCDTEGHRGCLEAGGATVAVLAHGFGRIYPACNKDLADEIVNRRGCLVSEYPPGCPPTRSSFVERDRLQSGLSLGIIVIETDIKGGTMHTVGHAIAQKRGLATISHPPHLRSEPKTQGNQKLIVDGQAIALGDRADLLKFASSLRPNLPEVQPVRVGQIPLDL